jgi:UDP-hydrolysing UDP-N-acetyl-D-glucosamine 2-epimerase
MKVAVVTGSRADYGLLRPSIEALQADPRFEPVVLVTAMHLEERHGLTIRAIEADGIPIAAQVPAGGPVERAGDFGRNIASATAGFTEALSQAGPDILLVLGDRFEVLAAALAATGLGIPIAHLHGGELSEGSLDDATRHCVTKLAHLHLVATRRYAERVCQLGEEPWRVHVVGATGMESIRSLPLLDPSALADALELAELERPLLSITLHPASLTPEQAEADATALTEAVDEVLEGAGTVVLTLPNDDPGSHAMREHLTRWARASERVHAFESLGQLRYLSLLRHADAIVGNSSSAVLEAPAFRLPAVDVGERQRGRIHPDNVLSVPAQRGEIARALRRALDPAFRESLHAMEQPYGDGRVSHRVLAVLAAAPPREPLRHKRFLDLPDGPWREQLDLGGTAPCAS